MYVCMTITFLFYYFMLIRNNGVKCRHCSWDCYWSVHLWSCIVFLNHSYDLQSLVCNLKRALRM